MKKGFTYAALCSLILSVALLTGCKDKTDSKIDESAYIGTYYGKHYLADSVNIRRIVGDENMIYDDTLIITNGSNTTDGLIMAKSSLLGAKSIEMNVSNGEITPVNIGDLTILSTTLKDTKVTPGSTGNWDNSFGTLNTHLIISVTYMLNGTTPVNLDGIAINGNFAKQ
jgi:hypothetical protein